MEIYSKCRAVLRSYPHAQVHDYGRTLFFIHSHRENPPMPATWLYGWAPRSLFTLIFGDQTSPGDARRTPGTALDQCCSSRGGEEQSQSELREGSRGGSGEGLVLLPCELLTSMSEFYCWGQTLGPNLKLTEKTTGLIMFCVHLARSNSVYGFSLLQWLDSPGS